MCDKKKSLIKLVFEKAKKEISQTSISSVAAYLSLLLEEKYGQSKNERSFVRYYKALIEDDEDYNIDAVTLDQLSEYIGYSNFSEFSLNLKKEPILQNYGFVKIAISDEENKEDQSSKITVNISNSPVFSIPEFISQHKNSLGIVGILLLGSLWFNQSSDIFKTKEENNTPQMLGIIDHNPIIEADIQPKEAVSKPLAKQNIVIERKKECMYWNEDHFEASYCDEIKNNTDAKPLDEERLKTLKKINMTDTLTTQNALGKVWYDKSDKQVEFFTHHGLHPINNKTLKPATAYIINKYANNN